MGLTRLDGGVGPVREDPSPVDRSVRGFRVVCFIYRALAQWGVDSGISQDVGEVVASCWVLLPHGLHPPLF